MCTWTSRDCRLPARPAAFWASGRRGWWLAGRGRKGGHRCPRRARRIPWRRLLLLVFAAATGYGASSVLDVNNVRADDTVFVLRTKGSGVTRRTGQILDYTGKAVTLQVAGGRQESIPAERVESIMTARVPDQTEADKLLGQSRFEEALARYRRAVDAESRVWVRREILASMVNCQFALGQYDRAGETFLIIVRSDADTQFFDTIPLAWKPRQPGAELARRANAWMDDTARPAARLLGASWLLSTNQRGRAMSVLHDLGAIADQRVALLAEAQTWRTQIVTASKSEIGRWQETLSRLDSSLRAGPYYIIGQALARQDQHDLAALLMMRVPILYPVQRDLAAECLLSAGEQLEKAGRVADARIVYRELISEHKQHSLVPVAEQRMQQLTDH